MALVLYWEIYIPLYLLENQQHKKYNQESWATAPSFPTSPTIPKLNYGLLPANGSGNRTLHTSQMRGYYCFCVCTIVNSSLRATNNGNFLQSLGAAQAPVGGRMRPAGRVLCTPAVGGGDDTAGKSVGEFLYLLVLKSYTRYTSKKEKWKSEIKTIQSTKNHVNNWLIHQIQSSVVSCIPGVDKIFSRIIINSNAQRTLCTNSVLRPV